MGKKKSFRGHRDCGSHHCAYCLANAKIVNRAKEKAEMIEIRAEGIKELIRVIDDY